MSTTENMSTDVSGAVQSDVSHDDSSHSAAPERRSGGGARRVTREPDIIWLNTDSAALRMGITTRTLYRFINEGGLPAYRMGRVIRVKQSDVDVFIDASRIEPGTLSHLYPDPISSPKTDDDTDDELESDTSPQSAMPSQSDVSTRSEARPAY